MKKTHTGKSTVVGLGVFADENIRKGEFLFTMKGKLFYREYRTRRDYDGEENFVPVAKNWWVNPNPPLRYVNHSCNPNAGFKSPRRMYARRDIKRGEEITLDYSTIEYFEPWDMPCSCRSPNCRKVIRSIQFLPLPTFRSYLPYIPRFLQKVYLQKNKKARI